MLINVHILGSNYFKQDIKLHNTNGYVDSFTKYVFNWKASYMRCFNYMVKCIADHVLI